MNVTDDLTPAALFLTRKYPPAIGGMEEFSFRLFESYPGRKRLIALEDAQWRLPIFLARALTGARGTRRVSEIVHLGDGMLAPIAGFVRQLSGARTAVTLHGQEITRDLPGYRPMLRRALRDPATHSVAVSAYTANEARSLLGVNPAVIHNGVNLERFANLQRLPRECRAHLGLPLDGPLIVAVGRLVKRKGIDWFVREVMPQFPAEVTFCIVGDGPGGEDVGSAVAAEPRAHWLGARPDRDVNMLYGLADLFVAPNIVVPGRPEGFGIAPAEAAAAGLPVLVSGVEGLMDMAKVYGLATVPVGDARAWTKAVLDALKTPLSARAGLPPRGWDAVGADYACFFAGLVRNGA